MLMVRHYWKSEAVDGALNLIMLISGTKERNVIQWHKRMWLRKRDNKNDLRVTW